MSLILNFPTTTEREKNIISVETLVSIIILRRRQTKLTPRFLQLHLQMSGYILL